MALTLFNASTNTAVQRAAYARKAFLWATKNNFFAPFIGKQVSASDTRTGTAENAIEKTNGNNSIIVLKEELKKEKGDTINTRIIRPLAGRGVAGDSVLSGNEEAIQYFNMALTVNQRRHAVKVAGMSAQRTFVDVLEDAKELLQLWLAEQVIETDSLLALSGLGNGVFDDQGTETLAAAAPSTYRHFVGGQTTAGVITNNTPTLSLASNDTTNELFGTAVISLLKRKAQSAGAGYPKIRPILYKGKKYYVCLVHPYQMKALKQETTWINAQKDANLKGEDNPIFSGAEGIYDGVLIHEYDRIETRLGDGVGTDPTTYFESDYPAASGVICARALFLGAGALCFGNAKNSEMKDEEKDYGNQMGVSIGQICGFKKTQFNGVDYGVIACDTAVIGD